jgi:rhodanese-related sulfurtransferase
MDGEGSILSPNSASFFVLNLNYTMKMKNLGLIIFAVTFISVCNAQKSEDVERITLETLKADAIGKDVQFIDVRTPEEYTRGHIDDALNIDIANLENFKAEVSKLEKAQPIYLYCHSGGRSNKASKVLQELGFQTIYDFSGGWKAWSQQ